jgi:hypothetical protein
MLVRKMLLVVLPAIGWPPAYVSGCIDGDTPGKREMASCALILLPIYLNRIRETVECLFGTWK